MSDFFHARFSASFLPDGQEEAVCLTRHRQLLSQEPEEEWSTHTASYEYIAHTWAGDIPIGNARLTRSWAVLIRSHTTASLEAKLRRLELLLNLHRSGTLTLEEAYSQGAPTATTYWHAVVETAKAHRCPLDQAPPLPGAWGLLELSLILTHPSEENPLSRRIEEEPDNPNPNPNQDSDSTTEDESTTAPYYPTGYITFANGRPEDDIGLYINNVHICTDVGGGGLSQDWAAAINAANCGVTATPGPNDGNGRSVVLLTSSQPAEPGTIPLAILSGPYWQDGYASKYDFISDDFLM